MATKRSKKSGKSRKGAGTRRTRAKEVATIPAALQAIAEELDEVVNEPLGPELPINPDAPLSALDADALAVLNETQTLSGAEPPSGGSETIDKRRAEVLSGGDVDAAWDQADAGEGTVGGSTPTPDQDMVDDLGRAAGLTYSDSEPLRPEEKVAERDDHRWEVNPASAEDYEERLRESRRRGTRASRSR